MGVSPISAYSSAPLAVCEVGRLSAREPSIRKVVLKVVSKKEIL